MKGWALALAVALVAHATVLGGGFVWLDHAHLEEGLALAPPSAWPALFTRGFAGTGFYRPAMALSLSVEAALGGAPWLYHLTTWLWHGMAAALVVLAAIELGLTRRAASLAGVLFGVHPAASLVVGAIAFRSESMITAALLAVIVLHRRERPWATAVALLLGALTKEPALVLAPVFIAILEFDRCAPNKLRRLAPLAGAWCMALALRLAFAPAFRASFPALSLGQAIGTRLAALAHDALLVVMPIDRHICDGFPVTAAWSLSSLVGAAVLTGVGVLAWRRRGPALLLAASLLPALQLVPIMRWWSPHYLYLPLAFAAMLVAERLPDRRGLTAALVPLAIGLAVVSGLDGLRFRSDESLWRPEVAAMPGCREGRFFLAVAALDHRRFDEAATHLESAIAGEPGRLSYVDRGAALQNLGAVRLEQGRFADALASFEAALSLVVEPMRARQLTHNLATAHLRAGHPREAIDVLAAELARGDAFPASLALAVRALHDLGRDEEARALAARLPPR